MLKPREPVLAVSSGSYVAVPDVFAIIVEDRVVIWCSVEDFPGQDMNAIRKLCKTKTLQEGLEMVELYEDKLTLRL
jgi:hypothetical protein